MSIAMREQQRLRSVQSIRHGKESNVEIRLRSVRYRTHRSLSRRIRPEQQDLPVQ